MVLTPNGLGGLDTIQVEDDGNGILPDEFDLGFGQLGDSWKKRAERTKTLGRALHGKKGIGRYRAFSLGGIVTWNTRFEADEQVSSYEITFDSSDRRTVIATDPALSTESTGTTVTISNPTPKLGTLELDAVKPDLTEHFALYLGDYILEQST